MKANEIKEVLLREEYPKGKKIGTTNFGGSGFAEADVILISSSNMIWEYEVKCSRADYKADFKKEYKHRMFSDRVFCAAQVEEHYDRGWVMCPNYFTYVCVEGLIKPEEVPAYAGLIYIIEAGGRRYTRTVKKVRKLHKYPATERLIRSIAQSNTAKMIFGCSYMNYRKQQSTAHATPL